MSFQPWTFPERGPSSRCEMLESVRTGKIRYLDCRGKQARLKFVIDSNNIKARVPAFDRHGVACFLSW